MNFEPNARNNRAEPRIVTPQEAQDAYADGAHPIWWHDLAHTVATEPDRTRAAVVKALRDVARIALATDDIAAAQSDPNPDFSEGVKAVVGGIMRRADKIEGGANYA